MVSKENKQELLKKYGKNPKDTGATEFQIALLTHDIMNLTEHLKTNKKDYPTKRSLLKKVAQRKHFLNYLSINNHESYKNIISDLSIRK
ncbi:30S ribosomal protein S15 [Spiroplasma endosymbiont of Amphibalanus improvisus]|uniref:30S ribosomal protein S15 n=1 Tax=Spiroplasma endosymbiont of Amphibalanus improvisus TaxID=3066327 RepID=UPI00313AAD3E